MRSVQRLLSDSSSIIMGVLNATPDSFSDGGRYFDVASAQKRARIMEKEGADMIDVGGESTRPGSESVSMQEELDRVIPVIEAIRADSDIPISIDTSKPIVMQEAVARGANCINDVNGLRADGALQLAAKLSVPVCIMHMRGTPQNMQNHVDYANVVDSVVSFFKERVAQCIRAGVAQDNIILDPGIGFAKTLQQNLQCLASISSMTELGYPVLVGVSKKSLLGDLLGIQLDDRMPASVALACQAVLNGAKIVRVHNVQESYQALRCIEAVKEALVS